MSKMIGCVYKDFAKCCDDNYYENITIEKFDDRGFDYLCNYVFAVSVKGYGVQYSSPP